MRRGESRDRGASLVEFAFVVPILALFLFGIVQFGIVYDKQQSINSAAREGARLGALAETNLEEIGERAVTSFDASASPTDEPTVEVFDDDDNLHGRRSPGSPDPSYSVDEDNASLMPCGETSPGSEFVTVRVFVPCEITIPFWGVRNITVDAEAEFRCE